jgi:hypothetical protein
MESTKNQKGYKNGLLFLNRSGRRYFTSKTELKLILSDLDMSELYNDICWDPLLGYQTLYTQNEERQLEIKITTYVSRSS